MGFKHTTYFNLLDALRGTNGCCLCHLCDQSVHRWFDALLYEAVNTTEMRTKMVESMGFCREHATELASFHDGLGTALLHQSVLLALQMDREGGFMTRRTARCMACDDRETTLVGYGSTLMENLKEREICDEFERGAWICIPHLKWIFSKSRERTVRQWALDQAHGTVESLLKRTTLFTASQNATGTVSWAGLSDADKLVWRDAIEFISGVSLK